jgi:uncharacterized protein YuzB (UPF0349 family)
MGLKEQDCDTRVLIWLTWFRIQTCVGFCERCSETLNAIKDGEYLE